MDLDITKTFRLAWTPSTTRTDGMAVTGAVTYRVELVKPDGAIITLDDTDNVPDLVIDPVALKLPEGDYTAYVRELETVAGVQRVSERSNSFFFTLDLIQPPAPPTNLHLAS